MATSITLSAGSAGVITWMSILTAPEVVPLNVSALKLNQRGACIIEPLLRHYKARRERKTANAFMSSQSEHTKAGTVVHETSLKDANATAASPTLTQSEGVEAEIMRRKFNPDVFGKPLDKVEFVKVRHDKLDEDHAYFAPEPFSKFVEAFLDSNNALSWIGKNNQGAFRENIPWTSSEGAALQNVFEEDTADAIITRIKGIAGWGDVPGVYSDALKQWLVQLPADSSNNTIIPLNFFDALKGKNKIKNVGDDVAVLNGEIIFNHGTGGLAWKTSQQEPKLEQIWMRLRARLTPKQYAVFLYVLRLNEIVVDHQANDDTIPSRLKHNAKGFALFATNMARVPDIELLSPTESAKVGNFSMTLLPALLKFFITNRLKNDETLNTRYGIESIADNTIFPPKEDLTVDPGRTSHSYVPARLSGGWLRSLLGVRPSPSDITTAASTKDESLEGTGSIQSSPELPNARSGSCPNVSVMPTVVAEAPEKATADSLLGALESDVLTANGQTALGEESSSLYPREISSQSDAFDDEQAQTEEAAAAQESLAAQAKVLEGEGEEGGEKVAELNSGPMGLERTLGLKRFGKGVKRELTQRELDTRSTSISAAASAGKMAKSTWMLREAASRG
jgi:hypothetical protein